MKFVQKIHGQDGDKNSKYVVGLYRRQSHNNGINYCQYYVIYNNETKEIIYDSDVNINSKYAERHLEGLEETCEELNNGKLKTRIRTTIYGNKLEEIIWK